MKFLTVGGLAARGGISRTALLYYEAAGLLRPAARSAAGYRLYGASELARLQLIRRYREAGIGIHSIRKLVAQGQGTAATLLQQRLLELKEQIDGLRAQQRLLARFLAHPEVLSADAMVSKARWVQLLETAGFTQDDMTNWHRTFEADAPEAHTRFLQAVGIAQDEIDEIRAWSRQPQGQHRADPKY